MINEFTEIQDNGIIKTVGVAMSSNYNAASFSAHSDIRAKAVPPDGSTYNIQTRIVDEKVYKNGDNYIVLSFAICKVTKS